MASTEVVSAKSHEVPTPSGAKPTSATIRSENGSSSPKWNPPTPRMNSRPSSSASSPTDTIVTCTLVIIGTSLVKDVAHGSPTIRPVVTGMILGGALLIIGTFAPTFAKLLAIFGMIGSLMTNGLELTQATGRITTASAASPPAKGGLILA